MSTSLPTSKAPPGRLLVPMRPQGRRHPDFDFARRMMTETSTPPFARQVGGASASSSKTLTATARTCFGPIGTRRRADLRPRHRRHAWHDMGSTNLRRGDAHRLPRRAERCTGSVSTRFGARPSQCITAGQVEIGRAEALRGRFEVPVVMISSDLAGAAEVRAMGLGGQRWW